MMRTFLIISLITVILSRTSCSYIDIIIKNHVPRHFPNESLGLTGANAKLCPNLRDVSNSTNNNREGPFPIRYTPNRRDQHQSINDHPQLAFVLALGGHSNTHYDYGPYGSLNGLMAIWDSWVENFFSVISNSSSIILLFDERDFMRLNISETHQDYLDTIVMKNMGAKPVDCINYRKRSTDAFQAEVPDKPFYHSVINEKQLDRFKSHHCNNKLHLDQGYQVYYIDKFNVNDTTTHRAPFIIFAGIHKFPKPDWAKDMDEEHLFIHWRPGRMGRFKTNYGYVKMTNWYAHHMLGLSILDFFEYAGKLDNDVTFVKPFPEPDLPLRLATKGAKMLVTQKQWYFDEPRVAQGIRQCLDSYISEEQVKCAKELSVPKLTLQPAGLKAHEIFWESNMNATFRAHFLVFWLGLYASPETQHLARYWNDWNPRGMWDYRWGDQQWWPRPLAMFSDKHIDQEIEHYDIIDTENEKYVVHKEWPRFGTLSKTNYFNINGSDSTTRKQIYSVASKPFFY